MNDKQKPISLLPEEFAEFWDNHDTPDYLNEFETVKAEVSLKRRRNEIEIDADLMPALTEQAHKSWVAVKSLVGEKLHLRRKSFQDNDHYYDKDFFRLSFK